MNNPNSPKRLLLLAALATVAIWFVPFLNLAYFPIQYLNTHIHELCHALATVATGGAVSHMLVFANGSGVAYSAGGIGIVIASAGYVGASLIGGWLISMGRTEKGARTALWALVGTMAAGSILWLRGDGVGFLTAVFWLAVIGLCARNLKGINLRFAAMFLGMQQCLASLQSLWVLLNINAMSGMRIENDAAIAADMTMIPALFWALLWSGLSLGLMGLGLRRAWSDSSSSRAESPAAVR